MDTKTVKIIFVIPSECTSEAQTSEEMLQAFEACRQNSINIEWHHEKECLELDLKKTDFLVFETFSGEVFEKVCKKKSVRIVGPWCLLTCLTEGRKIPNYPWPMYSVAMYGCTIVCSSLDKNDKKKVHKKIEYMAGYISTSLVESSTHLITDSVKSEKYIKAAESGIKLMLSSWVDEVWKASAKANVHCNDEIFNKHRCLPFHKLAVCCTGLSNLCRKELKKMVTENGGDYKEQLHVQKTDIVICEGGTGSAKYKAAKKFNIKCVSMQWVLDSIKNGYAMPDDQYPVKVGTSTPTKEGEEVPPNFSMISNIANNSTSLMPNRTQLFDATDLTTLTGVTPIKGSVKKRKSDANEHNELVDGISLKQVKKAGPFLDGCGIYLAGFGTEQREKLCKILNFSGATRYNNISERVTHVIVGDPSCHDLKNVLNNCPLVSIQWLLDSIAKQSPVNEERYIICAVDNLANEPSSPLSKKSLHLLRTKSNTLVVEKPTDVPLPSPQAAPEVDIVQQYLQPSTSTQDILAKFLEDEQFESKQEAEESSKQTDMENKSSFTKPRSHSIADRDASLSSAVDDDSSHITDPIFEGLKFIIAGFTEEQQIQIKEAIEKLHGKVVPKSYKGIPDYAVVPLFSSELKQVATEVVNDLWVTECWQENDFRPIEYFHQPISIKEDAQPLKHCVITISSYTSYERNFLRNLIIQLGGMCQELFSKVTSTKTGLLASTHLVSPEANGKKYTAAIKWNVPVLNKDWLLECARTSEYATEEPYLVGEAKCSARSKEISTNSIESISKSHSSSTMQLYSRKPSNSKFNHSSTNSPEHETPASKPQFTNTSFNTPPVYEKLNSSNAECTPVNKLIKQPQNTSFCSQITPVQKILAEARRQNLLGTPEQSLPRPLPWNHVDTPETPLGAFIKDPPSPNTRKEMVRFLDTLPTWKPRRDSTPLSELKRRLWDKICPPKDKTNENKPEQLDFDSVDDEVFLQAQETSQSTSSPQLKNIPEHVVNNQLQQLQNMLTLSSRVNQTNLGSRRQSTVPVVATEVKDSQPTSIRWDDCTYSEDMLNPQKVAPVFMFSGIEYEERETMITQLENLGAVVTSLANFDPSSTHLICLKPSRNEKILASMAAGKWILHPSFVNECIAQGKVVDEECFEFGNPKSQDNVHMQAEKENEAQLNAVHYWRKKITRRGYGAFHDMRVIIATQKRDAIVRIIQAGGGIIVEASPPFTQPVHATHCLLNGKSANISDYIPLARQGIYCVDAIYVNDFLQRTASDVRDFISPKLAEYYEC